MWPKFNVLCIKMGVVKSCPKVGQLSKSRCSLHNKEQVSVVAGSYQTPWYKPGQAICGWGEGVRAGGRVWEKVVHSFLNKFPSL